MKRCSKCGVEKPVSDFHKNKRTKDGLFAYCKECSRAQALAWRNANIDMARERARTWKVSNPERTRDLQRRYYEQHPEQYREYTRRYRAKYPERYALRQRRSRLRRDFGMSVEAYEAILKKQGGVCWICREPPKERWLCVDHDHATGAVRGLLCQKCNRTLGLYEDDPEWFTRAARYLRRKLPAAT